MEWISTLNKFQISFIGAHLPNVLIRYFSGCGALWEVLHGYVLMPQGFAFFIEFAYDYIDVL